MACMEHTCTECSWSAFNNRSFIAACPKCGGKVQSFWDEQQDHDEHEANVRRYRKGDFNED